MVPYDVEPSRRRDPRPGCVVKPGADSIYFRNCYVGRPPRGEGVPSSFCQVEVDVSARHGLRITGGVWEFQSKFRGWDYERVGCGVLQDLVKWFPKNKALAVLAEADNELRFRHLGDEQFAALRKAAESLPELDVCLGGGRPTIIKKRGAP